MVGGGVVDVLPGICVFGGLVSCCVTGASCPSVSWCGCLGVLPFCACIMALCMAARSRAHVDWVGGGGSGCGGVMSVIVSGCWFCVVGVCIVVGSLLCGSCSWVARLWFVWVC